MCTESIPFHIELNRIIELFSKQIYQSPLALLRENCQNAFDAILMRRAMDASFNPRIDIVYRNNTIIVKDNGIGMSREVLKNNFWKAGSSGKNTPEARAAGVVGTFGIGAMANFGIAESLEVHTKSVETKEPLKSFVEKKHLSASDECISISTIESDLDFGTSVIAKVQNSIKLNESEAKKYIEPIVRYVDIQIFFNDDLISTKKIEEAETAPSDPVWEKPYAQVVIGTTLRASIQIKQYRNGDVWCSLNNIVYQGNIILGEIILRQNKRQIATYRTKFALSPVGVSSMYGFGGIANLSMLEPTAGREALTTGSIQALQNIITEIENYISIHIANSEYSASNLGFMNWIVNKGRYELAGMITVDLKPDGKKTLEELKLLSQQNPINVYWGNDPATIDMYANEGSSLFVGSRNNPRRSIETHYLKNFCKTETINANPHIISIKNKYDWSDNEASFAFRLASILESDYFVKSEVEYAVISHNLPILVLTNETPIIIGINSNHLSISTVLRMYNSSFEVMGSVVKDFIRNAIFPKIQNIVPSCTRKGAEAFLKAIKSPKDIFEYQKEDQSGFSEIWQEYASGRITLSDAAHKSTALLHETVQIVNRGSTARVSEVLPDVVSNQEAIALTTKDEIQEHQALPAISRADIEVDCKLLVTEPGETPVNGYSCFLALSDRTRKTRGDFFLQPHRTEVIWGGQKVLFIFQHHSGEFGLYYELKSSEIISQGSGGGEQKTSTIIVKNRIFIPIPEEIRESFIPKGNSTKSFEVRFELLYPEYEE